MEIQNQLGGANKKTGGRQQGIGNWKMENERCLKIRTLLNRQRKSGFSTSMSSNQKDRTMKQYMQVKLSLWKVGRVQSSCKSNGFSEVIDKTFQNKCVWCQALQILSLPASSNEHLFLPLKRTQMSKTSVFPKRALFANEALLKRIWMVQFRRKTSAHNRKKEQIITNNGNRAQFPNHINERNFPNEAKIKHGEKTCLFEDPGTILPPEQNRSKCQTAVAKFLLNLGAWLVQSSKQSSWSSWKVKQICGNCRLKKPWKSCQPSYSSGTFFLLGSIFSLQITISKQ